MENQNETLEQSQDKTDEEKSIEAVVDLIELYHNLILHFKKRLNSSKKQITAAELDQMRKFFNDIGITGDMAKVLKEHVNYNQRVHEVNYGSSRVAPRFSQYANELPFPANDKE